MHQAEPMEMAPPIAANPTALHNALPDRAYPDNSESCLCLQLEEMSHIAVIYSPISHMVIGKHPRWGSAIACRTQFLHKIQIRSPNQAIA